MSRRNNMTTNGPSRFVATKASLVFATLTLLCSLLAASTCRAADITATGNGNWSSTNVDAPWPNGIVPSTNDSVDIEAPFQVTCDGTNYAQYVYGSGTLTMAQG